MFGLSWSKDENNLNDRFNDLWHGHNRLRDRINATIDNFNEFRTKYKTMIDVTTNALGKLQERLNAQSSIQTEQGREINKLTEDLVFVKGILNNHYSEIFETKECLNLDKKEILSIIDSSNKATSEGLASHNRIWEMLLWGVKNPPKHKEGDKCKYGTIIASNIVEEEEGFYWEYTAKGNDNSVTVF